MGEPLGGDMLLKYVDVCLYFYNNEIKTATLEREKIWLSFSYTTHI